MTNSWNEVPWSVRKRLKAEIFARDSWRCQVRLPECTGKAEELDHIISRSDGGPVLDPANLRASCAYCNRRRGAEIRNARRRGPVAGPSRDW